MNCNHQQHKRLSRRPIFLGLALLLSIVLELIPTGRASAEPVIVWPDTLATPYHRYELLPAMRPNRKTVGLALSGGGANGIAQIGVLKALEEERVPVDDIAGTSIGALVGGLYSSGYSAAELDSLARALPWEKLTSISNETPRTNSYLEQKAIRDRASIAIRFEKFKLVVPKSLSAAQPLTRTIDLLVLNAPYHTGSSFADLPVSFRAVTTDLLSGRRVTLTSGPLSEAMRASSTVPILNQPIERGGRKLADGGLVANLPVDELEKAGASYKVAVDTHGRMYTESSDIDVPWKAADQAMTILTQGQYPQQLEQADLVVAPDLEHHTATDFSDIPELIAAGYAKGRLLAPVIKRSIQIEPKRDTDLTGYSKSIEGIPAARDYLEQARTARALVRNGSRVKQTLHELLATDLFTQACAKIDKQAKTATFVLEPLPRLERVEVTGGPADAIRKREITEAFAPLLGKLYTNAAATRSLEKLIGLYRKQGYSLVQIDRTAIDDTTLTVQLTSGAIEQVQVEQDKKITKPLPIRREIAIDTDRAFRKSDAEKTIDNLYGIGVFNRVSLGTETPQSQSSPFSNTLMVRLDEKPANVLRIGVRYNETSNAQLLLDFRNENVHGTGNSLGAWTKIGQKNSHVNLEYNQPRIGHTPLTMFTRLFFDQRDIDTRQLAFTEQQGLQATGEPRQLGIQRYGLTAAFGTRLSKNGRLTADVTLQNAQSYLRDDLSQSYETGNYNLLSFGGQFTFDNRDSSFLPSEGRYTNIRYCSTPGYLNNPEAFWQLDAQHEENVSIGSATTLQLSALAGISSKSIPLTEKFFLGGTGNAYSYRFIGLKDSDLIGENIAVLSAMLRYKSPVQLIFPTSFILAYNIGNVWEQRADISLDELVQGAGAGLVWETPLGPAQFTVARPFAFENDEINDSARIDFSETLFYFSLGHDF
ncbi:MAG TPA: patatin [Chlorobaculum parvum]|uniref:Patatin n=1 Tax=Chlorobaculum parvum TaxID=274539 RepID=A0A7C5HT38_9CHLB|nr:patatin [Chlorobaculum parvum]